RRRATHPGDCDRDGPGRRTTHRRHAAHRRPRPRAVRPAAVPGPDTCGDRSPRPGRQTVWRIRAAQGPAHPAVNLALDPRSGIERVGLENGWPDPDHVWSAGLVTVMNGCELAQRFYADVVAPL